MAIEPPDHIPVAYLEDDLLRSHGIRLGMLRLDLVHPLVSGNKWYKLKENIHTAQSAGYRSLLTFGGAWSNHLLATAAAAQAAGMPATGLVRGLHGKEQPTETLQQCRGLGMELVYVSREAYGKKDDPAYIAALQQEYPGAWLIPEGGNNAEGMTGAGDIARLIPTDATLVALAIGTGTTFCGIRNSLDPHMAMLGFPVMKGGGYLQEEMAQHIHKEQASWRLYTEAHFGGFAKHSPSLIRFMNRFYEQHRIPLDFVYTAKMMYALFSMIGEGAIAPGSHLVAVHTGGLQGNRSIKELLCYS